MKQIKRDELLSLELFRDIKNETVEQVRINSSLLELKKNKCLFLEKQEVEYIYIVLNGKFSLFRISENGQKRVVYILGEGSLLNEVIFDKAPASINCEAFENSMVIKIHRKDMLKIMENDFEFTKRIINSMAKKIRRLYRQIKNTIPIKIDKKLAAKLWKLSRDYGICVGCWTKIDIKISITYLADMLGSSRETISRALKELEKNKLIRWENKNIYVKKEELSKYYRNT